MRNKSRTRPVGIPTGLRGSDNIEAFIADARGCHVEVHDDAAGWVEPLLNAGFSVSRHLGHASEDADMEVLSRLPDGVRAVAHPTHIKSVRRWREFQRKIMIENLDANTPEFRTPDGLRTLLNDLPDAGICLDMAHAYGIAGLAREFIRTCRGRIAEIHFSQILDNGGHLPYIDEVQANSMIVDVAALPGVPVVIEMFDTTVVDASDMIASLRMRIRACDDTISGLSGLQRSFDAELKKEWRAGVEQFQRELSGIKRKAGARI